MDENKIETNKLNPLNFVSKDSWEHLQTVEELQYMK